jgi:hypothetical protein
MKTYPSSFPTPLIDGYGIGVDMGLLRTPFESGRSRQRRRYTSMPTAFNFSFAVKVKDLDSWQQWVNQNAYTWFKIKAMSYLTGATNDTCSEHVVRFTSDLSITPITAEAVKIDVTAEQAPTDLFAPPVPLTDDWIIARTPANPSVDWYIARTPANPAPDVVVAGSPNSPAAIV